MTKKQVPQIVYASCTECKHSVSMGGSLVACGYPGEEERDAIKTSSAPPLFCPLLNGAPLDPLEVPVLPEVPILADRHVRVGDKAMRWAVEAEVPMPPLPILRLDKSDKRQIAVISQQVLDSIFDFVLAMPKDSSGVELVMNGSKVDISFGGDSFHVQVRDLPKLDPEAFEEGIKAETEMFYIQDTSATPDGFALWWKPNRCGHTTCLDHAGLYSRAEAHNVQSEQHVAVPQAEAGNHARRFVLARLLERAGRTQ